MTLASRGQHALESARLWGEVWQQGVSIHSRRVHHPSGQQTSIRYGNENQSILSVSRCSLFRTLLNAVEKMENVTMLFKHEFVSCDFDNGTYEVENKETGERIKGQADLLVGADGVHSVVREQMLTACCMNFTKTCIEHGYIEFVISAEASATHGMAANHLHIWPRQEFLMIALPNQDGSWNATLFMPTLHFQRLQTEQDFLAFFNTHFPDALRLFGEKHVMETFSQNKPRELTTVKCQPYHCGKAVLVGDAAHAMVPFYGQGVNCGFEDCERLLEFLAQYNFDLDMALPAYSKDRCCNAQAMSDLSLCNYDQMRTHVDSWRFRARHTVDSLLHRALGQRWIPLYTSVAFSLMPYRNCIENRQWQDKVLSRAFWGLAVGVPVLLVILFVLLVVLLHV